jgi:Tol biopolymer transport system component
MALIENSRLGPYEILQPIGAGSMGQVYKARDTRLNRTVAIKVLPPEFASRQDWKQRFGREAQTIASLNHPHICTLHDVGQQDGIDYLVMEFLEGQTLAERLERGALPLDEALKIAIEIADALDKAHRQGIVHRDLKPANVMLTKAGVKLLDFGLAKPTTQSAPLQNSNMPTGTPSNLTAEGTIIGTLQYMAPEQLEGKDVDSRSDIFAFGTVLYEMLAGQKAFEGKSQASVIASILERDPPPISSLQALVPKSLEQLITHCLAKSPAERWQTVADMLFQLRTFSDSGEQYDAVVVARKRNIPVVWMTAIGFLCAVMGATVGFLMKAKPPDLGMISFDAEPVQAGSLSLSPDGKHMASVVPGKIGFMLWIRALENRTGQAIPSTESPEGLRYPFWSPDGRYIGFFTPGKVRVIDILGGPAQTLCDLSGVGPTGHGGTWNRDGTILFASDSGPLFRISASGGTPTPLTELDKSREETTHSFPVFLPDGKHFLFLATSTKPENSAVYVGSLDSRERKRILASSQKAAFAPPDRILYMRGNILMSQGFDTKQLELVGKPFPVVEGVTTDEKVGAAGFSVSTSGILAYASGSNQTQLAWFDRTGKQSGAIGEPDMYVSPALSVDRQLLAASRQEGADESIWIRDLKRGTDTKFTFDHSRNTFPLWSPDGSRIVFASNRDGGIDNLYIKESGGSGSEELLLKSPHPKTPLDWSLDGKLVLFSEMNGDRSGDLWVLPVTSDGKPGVAKPLIHLRGLDFYRAKFSPDGKWLAYTSGESGARQVYVQSLPVSGTKYQISTISGSNPRWRHDGKELFFLSLTGELMSVAVDASQDGVFHAGLPLKLFETTAAANTSPIPYDVVPDGQSFLINSRPGLARGGGLQPITVILNWSAKAK